MKKILAGCLLAGVLAMASGCAYWTAPVVPPQGIAFSETSAPMSTNFSNTDLGTKRGESTSTAILGLFSFGDASVQSASQSGNVRVIKHADYKVFNILGVYQTFTTVVYGD